MTIKLKRIIIYKFFSILLLFTITNCISISVPPYSLSKQNIIDAKKIKTKYPNLKIKLGEFRETYRIKIYCDFNKEIKSYPDFANYVYRALKDELEIAEIYDEQANINLSGKLTYTDSNGFLKGEGKFDIEITLNDKKKYSVDSTFYFSNYAEYSCYRGTNSFLMTVQHLIKRILNHPELQRFIAETK